MKNPILHKALQAVKAGEKNNEEGICAHIYDHLTEFSFQQENTYLNELDLLIFKWTSLKELTPADKYYPIEGSWAEYASNKDKWDTSTYFGKLRWELLEWLIEQTK